MHCRQTFAIRLNLAGMALASALLSIAVPARAATVFDNYTGDTSTSFGTTYVAASFTPTANFDFTGEAAFVVSQDDSASEDFTLSLYSSTGGGSPDSALWTSPDLSVSNPGSFVSATYSGVAIPLQSGVQYFVVLHDIGLVNWYGLGSSGTQIYVSGDGSSWSFQGPAALQFAVYGDPGATAAPEASTWALLLAGFLVLGLAGVRGRRGGEGHSSNSLSQ
jgi:hypothetical protein